MAEVNFNCQEKKSGYAANAAKAIPSGIINRLHVRKADANRKQMSILGGKCQAQATISVHTRWPSQTRLFIFSFILEGEK